VALDKRSVTLRVLAAPTDVNFGGKVHGGVVMKWIDEAGYACAAAWSERYCVTVFVGGIRFIKPIRVGDLVELEAKIIHTGNSSMHILVSVSSKDIKTGDYELTTRCIIVFVATDDDGKPTAVNEWKPESAEDTKLEAFAKQMMEAREDLHVKLKPFDL
jgi:acyl-CoA hydrolase